MAKLPSPCIDVCKYRLGGHCIACSMTKAQKKGWKRLKGPKARGAFLRFLRVQQALLGGRFRGWEGAYARRCARRGVESPLDAPLVKPLRPLA